MERKGGEGREGSEKISFKIEQWGGKGIGVRGYCDTGNCDLGSRWYMMQDVSVCVVRSLQRKRLHLHTSLTSHPPHDPKY